MRLGERLTRVPSGRRTKWFVLGLWIVVFVVAAPLSGKLSGAQKNDAAAYLPKSAESTRVIVLQKHFADADTQDAVVVYARESGLTDADRATIAKQRDAARHLSGVQGQVSDVTFSKDGAAAEFVVPLDASETLDFPGYLDGLRSATTVNDGLVSHVTGPAGIQGDSAEVFKEIDGQLLYATLIVVIIVLLVTYRSPVLWLVPVVSAGAALVTAQAAAYGLTHAGLTVNGLSAGILLVLVFGAGTDYALLLVARYREELRRHEDKHEAMAFALHRAAPAILASSTTVVLSLLCLLVSELESNRGLGPVGAVGILCALIAMTTLLPALLTCLPRKVFWPFVPHYGDPSHEESGPWSRVGNAVARRPRRVWTGVAAVLVIFAFGLTSLNLSGLANKDQFTGQPDSVKGQLLIEQHFPSDIGAPAVVVGAASAADPLLTAVTGVEGVAGARQVASADGFVEIDAALTSPADSAAAEQTLHRLRAAVHAVPDGHGLVGGFTAVNYDTKQAAKHDESIVIPIVLVVVLIVLGVLLRAVVVPLVLMGTVVLSFAAALGASVFLFEHVFGFAGEDPSVPLYVFIFLVALGIDYNIFLMTRVREESAHLGTRRGVLKGLAVTGGVITSAGIVLAATFSVLAILPLVTMVEVGFAVAFGVLLDTFVVRSVLVPALCLDIGPRVWWPSKLAHVPDAVEPPQESLQVR